MTPVGIVHQRRIAAVAYAIRIGNISEAARVFGVSRKTLHDWKDRYDSYGPEGLAPKERRRPVQPNATPDHVIERLVVLAVTGPGRGARRYAADLSGDGYSISKSCVQAHLNRVGLGRRADRYAAAGRLALFTEGLLTEATLDELRDDGPYGFCHWSPAPGRWVQMDCFYIGNLKGVGKVWQLTATDVRTRTSDVRLIRGTPNSQTTARFLDLVRRRWTRRGFPLRGVITDNGGEFKANFAQQAAAFELDHQRIPARSPNHNAVVERFHQTMLEECWRPAFHRRFYTTIRQLQAQADSWLIEYHDSANHGNWMQGATPNQQLESDRPQ